MAKTPQTKTDQVVATLSAEQKDYLRSLIDQHANVTDIHRWLKRFDETLSYDSVLTYYHREYEISQETARINALINSYRGINTVDAHAASLAAVISMTNQITESYPRIEGMSSTILSNLVDLLREQRQSAQMLHNLKQLEDRKNLILSGGYRLAEILETMTRDTDRFELVKALLEGAIAKLETEV